MASLLRNNPNGTGFRIIRYFCHSCRRVFFTPGESDENASEVICDHCGSGFVEQMAPSTNSIMGLEALSQQGNPGDIY